MVMLEVNGEVEKIIFKDLQFNLPTIVNNTILSKIGDISFNSTIPEAQEGNYRVNDDLQNSQPNLSVLINNAFLGKTKHIPYNSTSSDQVKEQFITIKQEEDNENMIFEKTDKQVQLITTKVPFILPVPFP
jgi:hypothetical protein